MVIDVAGTRLFPQALSTEHAASIGFRFGAKGTHSSRTMMLLELSTLLAATRAGATRDEYASAVVEANCLAKATAASRRQTIQRISELYSLDFALPIFRVFRRLWDLDSSGRPLLAILCAIARDPLIATTIQTILSLRAGDDLPRDRMTEAVRSVVGERLNESTVGKVVRNASSSWTQSGHLCGRTFKKRQLVTATAPSVVFALYLGHAVGFRGADLFSSAWMAILDCSPAQARQLAIEAKRMGLIDLRMAGEIIELNLDRLDPAGVRN